MANELNRLIMALALGVGKPDNSPASIMGAVPKDKGMNSKGTTAPCVTTSGVAARAALGEVSVAMQVTAVAITSGSNLRCLLLLLLITTRLLF